MKKFGMLVTLIVLFTGGVSASDESHPGYESHPGHESHPGYESH